MAYHCLPFLFKLSANRFLPTSPSLRPRIHSPSPSPSRLGRAVKRGKDEGMMRKMEVEKLLKTLPVLQTQVDALLDFQVTADELRNGVINGAFLLLFKVRT